MTDAQIWTIVRYSLLAALGGKVYFECMRQTAAGNQPGPIGCVTAFLCGLTGAGVMWLCTRWGDPRILAAGTAMMVTAYLGHAEGRKFRANAARHFGMEPPISRQGMQMQADWIAIKEACRPYIAPILFVVVGTLIVLGVWLYGTPSATVPKDWCKNYISRTREGQLTIEVSPAYVTFRTSGGQSAEFNVKEARTRGSELWITLDKMADDLHFKRHNLDHVEISGGRLTGAPLQATVTWRALP